MFLKKPLLGNGFMIGISGRLVKQEGATMLEVLIAIVVFSFGMLGMLGLVLSSLKMSSTSNYRSVAAVQLAAMADALNANPVMIGDYLTAAGATTLTPTAACFTATGCTAAQLAATEYKLWLDRVADLLPSGAATLCRDSTLPNTDASESSVGPSDWKCDGNGRPVVKICWDESRVSTVSGSGSNWSSPCLINEL